MLPPARTPRYGRLSKDAGVRRYGSRAPAHGARDWPSMPPDDGSEDPRTSRSPEQRGAAVLRAVTSPRPSALAAGFLAAASLLAAAAPAAGAPAAPPPVVSAPRLHASWTVTATLSGRPAAWAARRSGVTLMRFDQRALRLELHPGTAEPGGGGWTHTSRIAGEEAHRVVAGFNSGFKFSYGSLGFMDNGRTAVPLAAGLASIVIYRDGTTQIGTWGRGVPAAGKRIVSVRQNLGLLIDHGFPAGNLESCIEACWGATDLGLTYVARSALGITASGELVWAAGASLSPAGIVRALRGAGVQRAVELDINPEWVNGFLYVHRRGGPRAVSVVPGEGAISGGLLSPYSRDFFTVVAR